MSLRVRPATPDDAAAVRGLALAHPYSDLRHYRHYGHDFASDALAREAEACLAARDASCLLALADGRPVGFAGLRPSAWESRHFGVRMAGLPFLFAAGPEEERRPVLDALVAAAQAALRERGFEHLSLRVDAEDVAALHAAERAGFLLVDTLVTYLCRTGRPVPASVRRNPELVARAYRGEELPSLAAAEDLAPLAAHVATAFRTGRFFHDPRLPDARCQDVYQEWLRKIFSGEWADGAHVIRRADRIVGLTSFRLRRDLLETYGIRILGWVFCAVLPDVKGGATALCESTYTQCPLESDFTEFDTQIQNYPVIASAIHHDCPCVRARFVLHRWLDE